MFGRQKGPYNQLSTRTSRTSGQTALSGRQSKLSSGKMHLIRESQKISFVRQNWAAAIGCRVVRVVRVDTSIVGSTKEIVEWKNTSH